MVDNRILGLNRNICLLADDMATGTRKEDNAESKNTRCIFVLKNILKNCQDVNTHCRAKKGCFARFSAYCMGS